MSFIFSYLLTELHNSQQKTNFEFIFSIYFDKVSINSSISNREIFLSSIFYMPNKTYRKPSVSLEFHGPFFLSVLELDVTVQKRAAEHSSKHLHLCSTKDRMSNKLQTA